jgi:hypothetical protein
MKAAISHAPVSAFDHPVGLACIRRTLSWVVVVLPDAWSPVSDVGKSSTGSRTSTSARPRWSGRFWRLRTSALRLRPAEAAARGWVLRRRRSGSARPRGSVRVGVASPALVSVVSPGAASMHGRTGALRPVWCGSQVTSQSRSLSRCWRIAGRQARGGYRSGPYRRWRPRRCASTRSSRLIADRRA